MKQLPILILLAAIAIVLSACTHVTPESGPTKVIPRREAEGGLYSLPPGLLDHLPYEDPSSDVLIVKP